MPVTWQIEFENGDRSTVYDSLPKVKAALPDHQSHQAQMSPRYSRPVRFVSSDGQKIGIPCDLP
jgi:hypothetical protein